MQKALLILSALLVLGALVLVLGPRPRIGPLPQLEVPSDVGSVAAFVAQREDLAQLRPDNQSRLLWAGEPGVQAPLSVVYLHGYSADPQEVEPVLSQVATQLGANLYMPLLAGHGRPLEAFGAATAAEWLAEVEQSVAVGRLLGERVVLVGTSTGGTLAALAALDHPDLLGLVLISPNFRPVDSATRLLLWPWGGLLARLLPPHTWEPLNAAQAQHWNTTYPGPSLVQMMLLVQRAEQADWRRLQVPTLVLHSPDDGTVSVPAMQAWMVGRSDLTEVVITPGADESHHVIAGDITAPSQTAGAVAHITGWLGEVRAR